MKYSYTVTGHNNTPLDMIILMNIFAKTMSKTHKLKTTCSSTLECSALNGAKSHQAFIPWENYNTGVADETFIVDKNSVKELKELDLFSEVEYDGFTDWEQRILLSSMLSLFDEKGNLDSKSSFVIHFNGEANIVSKTMLQFAKSHDIEIFDINEKSNKKRILSMLKKKKINIEKEVDEVISQWKSNPPIGVISCLKEELASRQKLIEKIQTL